jgi:hypothetical protein
MSGRNLAAIQLLLVLFLSCAPNAWASSEPVKSWYDPENGWFVYQWERPAEGTITAIDDPPNNIAPIITGAVEYDNEAQNYVYRFQVTNQQGKQVLHELIMLDIYPVQNATAPSAAWHMGLYKYDRPDTWSWAKVGGELHGIPAGESATGFSFLSKGVPAIKKVYFFGKRRQWFFMPGDHDTQEAEDSYARVREQMKAEYSDKFQEVVLRTVAPGPIPAELKPVDFLDSIIDMKHEAFSLGWITNKGIERSLDAKLDAARKKLSAGDYGTARNILDCPKGKHLLPEAYALLKYNAQYLADNLK